MAPLLSRRRRGAASVLCFSRWILLAVAMTYVHQASTISLSPAGCAQQSCNVTGCASGKYCDVNECKKCTQLNPGVCRRERMTFVPCGRNHNSFCSGCPYGPVQYWHTDTKDCTFCTPCASEQTEVSPCKLWRNNVCRDNSISQKIAAQQMVTSTNCQTSSQTSTQRMTTATTRRTTTQPIATTVTTDTPGVPTPGWISTSPYLNSGPHSPSTDPLSIQAESRKVVVGRFGTAMLKCTVTGQPRSRISWFRKGIGNATQLVVAQNSTRTRDGELHFSRALIGDSGIYICTAHNLLGHVSTELQLKVSECRKGSHDRLLSVRVQFNATWQAVIWDKHPVQHGHNVKCYAAIIGRRALLTTAHCVSHITQRHLQNKRFLVKVESYTTPTVTTNEQRRVITAIAVHQRYSGVRTHEHDIAVLHLESPLDIGLNSSVEKIRILNPQRRSSDACLDRRDYFSVFTGGGRYRVGGPNKGGTVNLREPFMLTMGPEHCEYRFSPKRVTSNMICSQYFVNRQRACRSDQGRPMAIFDAKKSRWMLVGIISWGDMRCSGQQSATLVSTRVSHYSNWIEKARKCVRLLARQPLRSSSFNQTANMDMRLTRFNDPLSTCHPEVVLI